MPVYCIQIELAPAELVLELGSIVGCFESKGDAEDFKAIAQHMPSLRRCKLTISEFPVQQHVKAQAQVA